MDFLSNNDGTATSHNSLDNSHINFLKKIKKQAKRLLQYANNADSITINNLAQAQELLAKINGYPSWHALEAHVSQDKENIYKSSSENIDQLSQVYSLTKKIENYYYYENKEKKILSSVFNINHFNDIKKGQSFIDYIEEIIKKIQFQFNMGFHNIEFLISKQNKPTETFENKNHSKNLEYNLMNIAKEWNIDTDFARKIFEINVASEWIDKNENENKNEVDVNIIMIASTEKDMAEEHSRFCDIIQAAFQGTLESREWLSNNEYMFLIKNEMTKEKYKFDITSLESESITKSNNLDELNKKIKEKIWSKLHDGVWIKVMNLLSEKKYDWDIHVDINNHDIEMYYTLEIGNTNIQKYLNGLFLNLMNNNNDGLKTEMFNYSAKYSKIKNTLPWKTGVAFPSIINGEINHYKRLNELFSSSVELIYAKPGSGKSTLMNVNKLETILSSDINNLPYLMTIDIGPVSSSLMSFIREKLPTNKRHLVQYYKMRLVDEFVINPFDTQLGSRFPSVDERTFLINFLLLLMTDPNKEKPDNAMNGLVQAVIDDMYMKVSDRINPKRYDKGIVVSVDNTLNDLKKSITHQTTWWEIVDFLFINGKIKEAVLAQRHAVPLLSDASSSAQDDKIKDVYSKVTVSTGENLVQYFNRSLSDALNQYRILGKPTVFDIGEARIVSLDLDEVAKSGGMRAAHQTAVMYMLALHILTKNAKKGYCLNNESYTTHMSVLGNTPNEKYQLYNEQQLKIWKNTKNIIYLDEFHRVSTFSMVKEQVIIDMREAYKWNLNITLASQSLKDFDETMKSFATGIFIMDGGTERDIKDLIDTFGIDDPAEQFYLSKGKIHGPRGGRPGVFMAKFLTNNGKYTQLLSLLINKYLFWILSTTPEDRIIKEKLTTLLSLDKAIILLGDKYPLGIKKLVEEKQQILGEHFSVHEVIDIIINEIQIIK